MGYFIIDGASNSNKHIRYVISNREDILKKVKPSFSLIYGQKITDFCKLDRIHQLATNLSTLSSIDPYLASELIHLVYSFNPDGQGRKVSFSLLYLTLQINWLYFTVFLWNKHN